MTKQEIKDLVAQKIAGQGSMVDVGGALPTILEEILNIGVERVEETVYDFTEISLDEYSRLVNAKQIHFDDTGYDLYPVPAIGKYESFVFDILEHRDEGNMCVYLFVDYYAMFMDGQDFSVAAGAFAVIYESGNTRKFYMIFGEI